MIFLSLLKLVPFRDWLWAALIAAALAWGGWTYHKYEAAVNYAAYVKKESAQAILDANIKSAADKSDYAAKLAASQEKQNADLKAAAAHSADLASRLRNYQTHRCPNAVLGSTPAPATGALTGSGSVDEAVGRVISAAAHDNAVIAAERAERDSLTGK